MAKWTGKSKGSLLGYKIFAFTIRKLGLRFSYFLLVFVATYYFLFSWKSSKYIYQYFKNVLKFKRFKAIFSVYKSYYIFGQTLIDRVAISGGMKGKFTYEFDGIEKIKEVQNKKKGGVLISAHVGNFEVSEYFFDNFEKEMQINVVTTDSERKVIKNYLESLSIKSNSKYILIKNDMSHIFDFNRALSDNEFICITGDRYIDGVKSIEADFLGKKASFPAGPFIIASKLKVPVLFVYVMKEKNFHYHLFAREAEVNPKDEKVLLNSYINSVTEIINKYPFQWFNYFDFWGKV